MIKIQIFTAYCCLILGAESHLKCHRGHFKYYVYFGPPICIPCDANTYMSEDNHEYTGCRLCSEPNVYNHEVLVQECTSTDDTVIECAEGFYGITVGPHGYVDLECNICSTCGGVKSFVVRRCTKTSDTVCCENPGSLLEFYENGTADCKYNTNIGNGSTFVCQRGQYLNSTGSIPRCIDCPPGTYSDKDNHQYRDCALCTQPENIRHEILISNCTAVSDAVIGCNNGYFGILRHEGDLDCQKCSDCRSQRLITARPCGATFDAVCCRRHGMRIQDSNDGQGRCLD